MRLRPGSVRGRFTAVSLALVAAVVLVSGAALEVMLRRALDRRLEDELSRHVDALEALFTEPGVAEQQAFRAAERMARAAGLRFTLIDGRGQVRADSHVADARLPALEDHTHRPEVERARRAERGVVKRMSTTIHEELLYLARPLRPPPELGSRADWIVRVAMPSAAGEAVLRSVRLALLATGAVALALAALMSLWGAHLATRSLRELVVEARALAEHRTRARIRLGSEDELELLAGSVNRLAGEVDDTLSTLEAERDRFQAVVEGIGDGVLSIDAQGTIQLMNSAARTLLERSDDGRGLRLADVLPAVDVAGLLAQGPGATPVELELSAHRRVLVHAAPTAVRDGAVLVLEDVTEVRRLENVRRDFVANVSHELRTPVSVIRASAEALIDGGLDDKARATRFAGAVHRNAERLSRLVSDLLDLARIESGRQALTVRPLVVRELVVDVVGRLQPMLDERHHAVKIDIPPDLTVLADDSGLEQVLTNLVDNAAKYTPEAGCITVRADATASTVSIRVEDNGPGIPPEHRERIFERFYRVDTGRSRDMGGTGLGLSIVKHLIAIMGGDVRVEAAEPRGACFVVTLPRDAR